MTRKKEKTEWNILADPPHIRTHLQEYRQLVKDMEAELLRSDIEFKELERLHQAEMKKKKSEYQSLHDEVINGMPLEDSYN